MLEARFNLKLTESKDDDSEEKCNNRLCLKEDLPDEIRA